MYEHSAIAEKHSSINHFRFVEFRTADQIFSFQLVFCLFRLIFLFFADDTENWIARFNIISD